eukprot:2432991-Prymnesium_polylepis.2
MSFTPRRCAEAAEASGAEAVSTGAGAASPTEERRQSRRGAKKKRPRSQEAVRSALPRRVEWPMADVVAKGGV